MVNNADLISMFETDLDRLIMVARRQGIPYPKIFFSILDRLKDMILQCATEEWIEHRD